MASISVRPIPAARSDARASIVWRAFRRRGAAILLQEVDIPAARNVVGMPGATDECSIAALERSRAAADAAREGRLAHSANRIQNLVFAKRGDFLIEQLHDLIATMEQGVDLVLG